MIPNKTYAKFIYGISFLDFLGMALIFPMFGNHLKSLGASHFTIGLLGTIYAGIQIISGPLIGSWSDIKDRKNVLKIVLLLCGVGYLCLGFVESMIYVLLIRIYLGCFKHIQGICKAMIVDICPLNNHGEMLARTAVLATIGFNIGPIFGGYISELPNGFTYLCTITFLFYLFNIYLCSFLPSVEPTRRESVNNTVIYKVIQEFSLVTNNLKQVNWTENGHLFAMRLLFGISHSLFFHIEALYLKEFFDLGPKHVGYVISFFSFVQTCIVLSLSHLNRLLYGNNPNCFKQVFHFFLIMFISNFCLYFVNDLRFFLLWLIPFSSSLAVLRISTTELLLKNSDKSKKGTFSGVSNSIMSVSRFVTPVMSGIITDTLSTEVSILLPCIPAAIGAILTFKTMRKEVYYEKNR